MSELTGESVNRSIALLGQDDPACVIVQNAGSLAPVLLVCDHAGRAVPRALGDLGLPAAEFDRHIAYDIGAAGLALALAEPLGAALIQQAYSRLVIDCNREPGRADAIPTLADGVRVGGNVGLSEDDRARRVAAIHRPYHAAIRAELDVRERAGVRGALVLIHSFTPQMGGVARPWQVGVLHQGNALSLAMLYLLRSEPGLVVGDNEPYAMDEVDFTAPLHAQARGLQYLELETRQDLIGDEAGQRRFADLYARLIPQALARIEG